MATSEQGINLSIVMTIFLASQCQAQSAVSGKELSAPSAEAPTFRVAAVQMRSTRSLVENMDKIRKSLEECAKDGVRVVVFPECAVTGYFDDQTMKSIRSEELAAAERELAVACRTFRISAIVGMPVREGERLYNSAVVIRADGKIIERYHKNQLAEDWPDEGDHLSVFRIDGVPCSIIICHDERYPELVRLPVLAGARCVFYVSHESGVLNESKIEPYRAQIQARAVENSVYVVQANAPANKDSTGSHGQSRILAPDGNILEEARVYTEQTITATLDLRKATGHMARMSMERGPLRDWWREGVKRVRVIED